MEMVNKKKKILKLIIWLLVGVLFFNLFWQTIIYFHEYGSYAGDGHAGRILIVFYVFVIYQFYLSFTAFFNLIPLILKSKLLSFLSFNLLNYLVTIFYYLKGDFEALKGFFIPYLISITIASITFILLVKKLKKAVFAADPDLESSN